MGTRARTQVDGERFIHKELWRVVGRQLDRSAQFPQGSMYDDMIAMVFAFHAFEAYLNYVGEHLAPEIWKDERKFFQGNSYRGFDGKVRKVLELCEIAEPARDGQPYSTVWLLKDLRDVVAHGKVERVTGVVEHSIDEEPPWMTTALDRMVTAENAQRASEDILAVAMIIHEAARSKVSDIWFGRGPFDGVLAHSERSKTVAT
jgi:hypothetical protein